MALNWVVKGETVNNHPELPGILELDTDDTALSSQETFTIIILK